MPWVLGGATPGCHWCDLLEGEFKNEWKDGCRWWRREDAPKPRLRGASPALGRATLHSALCSWGEGWEPSAASRRLCRKERSASCAVVPGPDPVGCSG